MALGVVGTFILKEEAPGCGWLASLSSVMATRVDMVLVADMTSLSVGSESSSLINPSD